MFTFGIFTTHLPYIAFVLFYGFVFLVGIDNASAGNPGKEERIIQVVAGGDVVVHPDTDDSAIYEFNGSACTETFKPLVLYGGSFTIHWLMHLRIKASGHHYSWFSRPPPTI